MGKIEEFVKNCYRKYLGREPDDSGFGYYVSKVRNGEIKLNDLPSLFEKSEEFMARKIDYSKWWKTRSFEDAKKLILSPDGSTPTTEFFTQAGRSTADYLQSFVDKNSEVVDYGCGVGRVARFLSPHAKLLHGVDISPEMIKLAKEFCKDCNNIDFVQTNGIKIPLEDSSIDFVYSILTLQHVEREDAYLILRELNRILKTGGKIYLTFPDITSEEYWVGFENYAFHSHMRISGRARMYTVPEVEMMLRKSGFQVIEIPSHIGTKKEGNIRVIAEKILVL